MRKALLLAVIVVTVLSGLGCRKSGGAGSEAVQTNIVYDYTYDKREVFITDANDDLTDLDQKINELSENVMTASAAVKAAAQPKIEDLRKQRAVLGKKLSALGNANESSWNALKADYQNADTQMKASLRESWQWIKDNTRS